MTDWNDETAEWYAEKYGEYATNRLAVDALEIAPDATIVDVGCGTGAALRHAASVVTDGQLVGVDPVERMVEIACERLDGHATADRIEFRLGAASALPVDDGFADLVFAFDSFDHWEDQRAGLAEVRRVLRTDGRFFVVKDQSVPGGDASRAGFRELVEDEGFEIQNERELEGEGVSFMMWECLGVLHVET
jgi:ubiquinone/menaquinone biosynthesis C-methylase UbiE